MLVPAVAETRTRRQPAMGERQPTRGGDA